MDLENLPLAAIVSAYVQAFDQAFGLLQVREVGRMEWQLRIREVVNGVTPLTR